MSRSWNPKEMPERRLATGVTAKIAAGERLMFSLVTLDPGAVVPEHLHPHEQMGILLSGTMDLTVAGVTRRLGPLEIYLVPGAIPHAATAGPGGAVTLDAFSPPREEYR